MVSGRIRDNNNDSIQWFSFYWRFTSSDISYRSTYSRLITRIRDPGAAIAYCGRLSRMGRYTSSLYLVRRSLKVSISLLTSGAFYPVATTLTMLSDLAPNLGVFNDVWHPCVLGLHVRLKTKCNYYSQVFLDVVLDLSASWSVFIPFICWHNALGVRERGLY